MRTYKITLTTLRQYNKQVVLKAQKIIIMFVQNAGTILFVATRLPMLNYLPNQGVCVCVWGGGGGGAVLPPARPPLIPPNKRSHFCRRLCKYLFYDLCKILRILWFALFE